MSKRTATQNSSEEISNSPATKNNHEFKFSLDSLSATTKTTPASCPTNLHFVSQNELGKLLKLKTANNNINNVTFENATTSLAENDSTPHPTITQLPSQPYLRKIARPVPPSLNTNINQLILANVSGISDNNCNIGCNNNLSNSLFDSPDDAVVSGHRRRDSNVSAMSVQLYDIGSGHRRRDSNVSNISMQLDTPTPSSGTESGNEEESKFAFFPFVQKLFTSTSRPNTPTTPPPCTIKTTNSPFITTNPHQRIRRMSLDSSNSGTHVSSDQKTDKQSPIHRAVRSRRASLLPKSKSFQRVVNELQEEARPIETEIKQEYKTTKVLKNEHDVSMDHAKLPEEFLVNWIKFRDIQPSPPPYASSKLNPEIDILFRQDTPSPTSLAGPWSVSGRSKRKASDDRFEPYFNPKRRAVSPSLVGLTAKGNLRGNSNLVNIHDANGSFSRLNLNNTWKLDRKLLIV
ncbi:7043_t:CDS:2 [Entrophospora sp. SA101]|nr:7043_t:CDS:2 [Entrophospora sp. SA101]